MSKIQIIRGKKRSDFNGNVFRKMTVKVGQVFPFETIMANGVNVVLILTWLMIFASNRYRWHVSPRNMQSAKTPTDTCCCCLKSFWFCLSDITKIDFEISQFPFYLWLWYQIIADYANYFSWYLWSQNRICDITNVSKSFWFRVKSNKPHFALSQRIWFLILQNWFLNHIIMLKITSKRKLLV